MSIKDNPIRVIKKGKTRGRPSKTEIYMSGIYSQILEDNKEKIKKAVFDSFLYGWPQQKEGEGK